MGPYRWEAWHGPNTFANWKWRLSRRDTFQLYNQTCQWSVRRSSIWFIFILYCHTKTPYYALSWWRWVLCVVRQNSDAYHKQWRFPNGTNAFVIWIIGTSFVYRRIPLQVSGVWMKGPKSLPSCEYPRKTSRLDTAQKHQHLVPPAHRCEHF